MPHCAMESRVHQNTTVCSSSEVTTSTNMEGVQNIVATRSDMERQYGQNFLRVPPMARHSYLISAFRCHVRETFFQPLDETVFSSSSSTSSSTWMADDDEIVTSSSALILAHRVVRDVTARRITEALRDVVVDRKFALRRLAAAFDGMEVFAVNLIAYPWKPEMRTILTYSGFFKSTIEPSLGNDDAATLLRLLGYESAGDVTVVWRLASTCVDDIVKHSDVLAEVAFDLFLASERCRYLADKMAEQKDSAACTDIERTLTLSDDADLDFVEGFETVRLDDVFDMPTQPFPVLNGGGAVGSTGKKARVLETLRRARRALRGKPRLSCIESGSGNKPEAGNMPADAGGQAVSSVRYDGKSGSNPCEQTIIRQNPEGTVESSDTRSDVPVPVLAENRIMVVTSTGLRAAERAEQDSNVKDYRDAAAAHHPRPVNDATPSRQLTVASPPLFPPPNLSGLEPTASAGLPHHDKIAERRKIPPCEMSDIESFPPTGSSIDEFHRRRIAEGILSDFDPSWQASNALTGPAISRDKNRPKFSSEVVDRLLCRNNPAGRDLDSKATVRGVRERQSSDSSLVELLLSVDAAQMKDEKYRQKVLLCINNST